LAVSAGSKRGSTGSKDGRQRPREVDRYRHTFALRRRGLLRVMAK
jgi:hypothetical protein